MNHFITTPGTLCFESAELYYSRSLKILLLPIAMIENIGGNFPRMRSLKANSHNICLRLFSAIFYLTNQKEDRRKK
ncbi:hypothetical protein ACOSQ4_032932 [Xanthoceras sorbifolium]